MSAAAREQLEELKDARTELVQDLQRELAMSVYNYRADERSRGLS